MAGLRVVPVERGRIAALERRIAMKLRARRGAVVVMLGIMMVALVSVSAISIDFSRLWALRNELQTSADAAAHAGAIQLLPPNNAANTIATATSYANVNL